MKIKEVGRILVSLALAALAGFCLYIGLQAPETAQALGLGIAFGSIISFLGTYWLKGN